VLRALLLAPPGAGKGTQGERLAEIYGVPHLSSGDLLRAELANRTPRGVEALDYMERGELVPDRIVMELILDRISGSDPAEGFVLDGFPRNLSQAIAAYNWGRSQGRTFHAVISLDVPEDELVRRLLERGRATGRLDDTEDTIRRRLRVYRDETEPLKEYYRARDVLVEIPGTGAIDEITERITAAIDARIR
jgi:adenylate kinase